MREIMIGEKQVRVRATPLALLYYRQEFGSDLVGDMVKMKDIEKDPSQINAVVILQIIWSMAKADAGPGDKFPSFFNWVGTLDSFDVSDSDMLQAVISEAADGFFRRESQSQGKRSRK